MVTSWYAVQSYNTITLSGPPISLAYCLWRTFWGNSVLYEQFSAVLPSALCLIDTFCIPAWWCAGHWTWRDDARWCWHKVAKAILLWAIRVLLEHFPQFRVRKDSFAARSYISKRPVGFCTQGRSVHQCCLVIRKDHRGATLQHITSFYA